MSHAQERSLARSFGAMPLVVLTHTIGVAEQWQTPEENAVFEARWRDGHAALAARSSRGRLVIVPKAGHFIQKDQPDAVISSIKEVIEAVNSRRATH
ncbi:MAG: hypothetical protein EOO81_05930 [Oxalobacteraceae bacterium]|nr:MAG: hypothetical protein EOO81_05930 [Oxalobacteraceae bacterium]